MWLKKYDFAIINRSFWPNNQIIGESLLQLGENLIKENQSVVIITQYKDDLKKYAKKHNRGPGIFFYTCKSRSDSSSSIIFRIIDAMIYMLHVFWGLLLTRPNKIYVSTDPPLIIPFVVFLYSKISKSSYVYHIQDIHPEATNVVIKLHPILFWVLKKIDGIVIKNAIKIITITKTMKDQIIARSNSQPDIYIINNPTLSIEYPNEFKIKGFIFSGNLGRLQRIPLLIKSIEAYKSMKGTLPFLFVGGGVYADQINKLSKKYSDVQYKGLVDALEACQLTSRYEWGLLPIDDEITKFAFPSKTSSYISCRVKILSICNFETSVAKWVLNNSFGINCLPNLNDLVDLFFKIEKGFTIKNKTINSNYYSIENFVKRLSCICSNKEIEK